MINIILGDERYGPLIKTIWPLEKKPKRLHALEKGSFKRYCKQVIKSSDTIKTINHQGEVIKSKLANDDICVHFCNEYLSKSMDKGVLIYKIATAIEIALDLGLDVKVIAISEGIRDILEKDWPEHWPLIEVL